LFERKVNIMDGAGKAEVVDAVSFHSSQKEKTKKINCNQTPRKIYFTM